MRAIAVWLVACGCRGGAEDGSTDSPSSTDTDETGEIDDSRTLANCGGSVGNGVTAFWADYFDCVDVTTVAGTTLASNDLPPHPSPYYPTDDPNWVAFDDRGGSHHQNPNTLGAQSFEITIPDAPVAKGITIDDATVDNAANTSPEEYGLGGQGIGLNGVELFAAMAAPGDELAEEAFTFDLYEGHPAGTAYHYHIATKGPLEVLVDKGISASSTPGSADVELYGVFCDGTLVLGCTELDGSDPSDLDFDAQNGHVHDVGDGTTVHFANRYHTHVCPGSWPDYPFFPEIAYYETTGCPAGLGPP